MSKKQKRVLGRIIISSVLMIALTFIPAKGIMRFFLYMLPYLIIGYDILRKAVYGIFNRQVFDENFLMAIATVGAILIALGGRGDYVEAIAVMLFYQIGELLQSIAVGKSRKSISALMDIRPEYANLEENGHVLKVSPETVKMGSIIRVLPGERVPIDSVVLGGESSLDMSALTGESMPVAVSSGEAVISGCINMTGVLRLKTTKLYNESAVSRIMDLVENASSRKSKSEKFISRFAAVYTPLVCAAAVVIGIFFPLIQMAFTGGNAQWGEWIYRALTFLVVSCPCALVISIPLSFFAGIGCAGKEGILVKGSNFLEALSRAQYVVFDKTGTLTKGEFSVSKILSENEGDNIIELAALAESSSLHPIAKSIIHCYGKQIDESRVKDIREVSGKGVIANIDGKTVAAGNATWMEELKIHYRQCEKTGTAVYVAEDGCYKGCIIIEDSIKPHVKEAIAMLKNTGVKKTVMLTGDRKAVAESVADKLYIDLVYSELLPEDKVLCLEKLLSEKSGKGSVVFVGDGINDAPVISRADVGIAMGAIGSDAAIEAADVVLMDDDISKISKAIAVSKKCMQIVYQNSSFAIGVKLACLLLAAVGFANMYIAIFADVGVMLLAVLNSMRAMKIK